MKIGLVIKPPADEERLLQLRGAVRALRAAGHQVRARTTHGPGDARRLAHAAARGGHDLVIAAGGDGTVNEVANGLAHAQTRARLGVVPLGTANDFARGLNIPDDIEAAVALALGGRPLPLDLGCVNGRYFVNVSTGGFGARATTRTPGALKRLLGPLAYLATGAKQFVELAPAHARFRADGVPVYEGEFVFFACGNGRRTGGGTCIAPRASVRDGQLDIVIVPWMSRLRFLSLLPELRKGSHLDSPDVLYLRAARLEVRARALLAVSADGEPLQARTFVYTVHPHPLTIMTP